MIDWRRRPDGRLAVFEVNPRLGASLMRPENGADLAAAIGALLAAALPPRRSGR